MGTGVLNDSVQYVKGIGPQRAKLLKKLGLNSVEDTLFYLPYRYEDRSAVKRISDLTLGMLVTVQGEVILSEIIHTPRKRFKIYELTVSDGTGIVKAKWFNQPFLKKIFKKGQRLFLSGVVRQSLYSALGFEMENPEYEFIDDKRDSSIHTSRIVPVYKTVSGIGQKSLRTIMFHLVQNAAMNVKEYIPEDILKKYSFVSLEEAIKNIHFSEQEDTDVDLMNRGESKFHQRLAFDELFLFQLGVEGIKKGISEERGHQFSCKQFLTKKLMKSLPFSLTLSQNQVIDTIFRNMELAKPMNMLLQGDVGSGKTIVAVLAMLRAVECGYQAVMMVPTEILAQQHYLNIINIVKEIDVQCSLLTSKCKEGEANSDIIIGTHALIQEGTVFNKLGLVIIDEQHRFGVRQRALIREKGYNCDVLVMTATPIPRSLAMTLYGDMDYLSVNELPPGRTPVETIVIEETRKKALYELIYREVKAGGQVYVVYPIIEEGGKINLRSAEMGKEALAKIFPKFSIELVHGKMKPDLRQEIMSRFNAGNINILVSTTVIEVGVDVQNANVMVIVHAERFGLSQLHQLRGRVGRGKRKSCCVLLAYGNLSEDAQKRLSAMQTTNDGFKIAEEDLRIRGPGDFFGTKQSGYPDLRVANIFRDVKLLECAKKEAVSLLHKDPFLRDYALLREKVNTMWKDKFELFKTV